jgi:hypothetical protein
LKQIGDPSALPALRDALEAPPFNKDNPSLQSNLWEAIKVLTTKIND